MVRINTSGDIVPKSNNIIFSAQELRNIEARSSALIWFKYNNPRREKCYNLQLDPNQLLIYILERSKWND